MSDYAYLITVELDAQTLHLNPNLPQQVKDGLLSVAEHEDLGRVGVMFLEVKRQGWRVDGHAPWVMEGYETTLRDEVRIERLVEVAEMVLTRVLVPADSMVIA